MSRPASATAPTTAPLLAAASAAPRRRGRRWSAVHRRLVVRLAIVLVIVAIVLIGPFLTPFNPEQQNILERLTPPGTAIASGQIALLGTDQFGRDVLSRLLSGGRVSLLISVAGVAVALLIGVTLGLVAGYRGGASDTIIMRLVDIQLGFPGLLLAIVLVAALGPGLWNVILALGIARWTTYARVIRGTVLSLKRNEFVEAAVVLGATEPRVLTRHILPNTLSSIIVLATLHLGQIILAESALSFIGLGVQPPTPAWGAMINEGREYITSAWWLITFPGLTITGTVLAIGLLGDAIRDALDPRLRTRAE